MTTGYVRLRLVLIIRVINYGALSGWQMWESTYALHHVGELQLLPWPLHLADLNDGFDDEGFYGTTPGAGIATGYYPQRADYLVYEMRVAQED